MKSLLFPCFVLLLCGALQAVPLDGGTLSTPALPEGTGAADSNGAEQIPEIKAGLEALQKNDIEGALKKFEEARAKHPEFSPSELMLAKLALQINAQSNGGAARMLIEKCVLNNPADPEAYLFLGDYNLGNGSVTEADLLFRQAGTLLNSFNGNEQRKKAMDRQYNAGMALVLERRGQFAEAQKYMESFLAKDPENVAGMQQIARILLQMDKAADALTWLKKAKGINDKLLTPEAIVAMFYQQKGDQKTATTYMINALNEAPKDLNTRLAASQWSQQIGSLKQAIQQADAALKLDPTSESAMLLRGSLALISKDYTTARTNFEAVLAKSPSNFPASNNLALALCESTEKADQQKAMEYAGINAQRFSKQPETFSTLGYVLLKNGQTDQALQSLQQAINLSNGRMSPDTAYYLCAALNAKNAPEGIKQAKEILAKTLEASKTFAMRPEAEKLNEELKNK